MATAAVVLAPGFEEIEAVTPIDLLRRAGVEVTVLGLDALTVVSARGLNVTCDALLTEGATPWDALILPGGAAGAQALARSERLRQATRLRLAEGRWVAALCATPVVVLGGWGLLDGRRFTGYPGTAGPVGSGLRVDDAVVVDGPLVTSQGVGTAAPFALKLVELLQGPEQARTVARATLLAY